MFKRAAKAAKAVAASAVKAVSQRKNLEEVTFYLGLNDFFKDGVPQGSFPGEEEERQKFIEALGSYYKDESKEKKIKRVMEVLFRGECSEEDFYNMKKDEFFYRLERLKQGEIKRGLDYLEKLERISQKLEILRSSFEGPEFVEEALNLAVDSQSENLRVFCVRSEAKDLCSVLSGQNDLANDKGVKLGRGGVFNASAIKSLDEMLSLSPAKSRVLFLSLKEDSPVLKLIDQMMSPENNSLWFGYPSVKILFQIRGELKLHMEAVAAEKQAVGAQSEAGIRAVVGSDSDSDSGSDSDSDSLKAELETGPQQLPATMGGVNWNGLADAINKPCDIDSGDDWGIGLKGLAEPEPKPESVLETMGVLFKRAVSPTLGGHLSEKLNSPWIFDNKKIDPEAGWRSEPKQKEIIRRVKLLGLGSFISSMYPEQKAGCFSPCFDKSLSDAEISRLDLEIGKCERAFILNKGEESKRIGKEADEALEMLCGELNLHSAESTEEKKGRIKGFFKEKFFKLCENHLDLAQIKVMGFFREMDPHVGCDDAKELIRSILVDEGFDEKMPVLYEMCGGVAAQPEPEVMSP